MYLHRLCLDILSVLVVETFLGNLAYVYLWVEVGGKCFVMVSCIAVHDVEVLYLVEVVLCCVCGEYACDARVETASENGAETSLLKAFAVSLLP